MTAYSTIDPDQVNALNRLIREKTGRLDGGPQRIAAPRKNLWLQMPPATRGTQLHKPHRVNGSARSPITSHSSASTAQSGDRGKRVRQVLTLLLGAALLVATAATALDLLSLETGAPTPTTADPAPSAPRGSLQSPANGALAEEIGHLRNENARLRERLQALESTLQTSIP